MLGLRFFNYDLSLTEKRVSVIVITDVKCSVAYDPPRLWVLECGVLGRGVILNLLGLDLLSLKLVRNRLLSSLLVDRCCDSLVSAMSTSDSSWPGDLHL